MSFRKIAMKLPQFVLVIAFANLAISQFNSSAILASLLKNPASVGFSSLSGAAVQQIQELESNGGGLNNCQIAVSKYLRSRIPKMFESVTDDMAVRCT